MSQNGDTLKLCPLEVLTKVYRSANMYSVTGCYANIKIGGALMQLYDESVLSAIHEYIKQYQMRNGKSPSYREIGKNVGVYNPGKVARYIHQLEIRGLIGKDRDGSVAIDPKLFSGRTQTASLVGTVACGMPIFAEENIEGNFELPVEIFGNEEHFLLHAKGYSMVEKGIYDGDIIVAKRQNTADAGQVVVALIDDDATTKIFLPQKDHYILRAANNTVNDQGERCYPDIITDHCEILGVVDNVIHRVR